MAVQPVTQVDSSRCLRLRQTAATGAGGLNTRQPSPRRTTFQAAFVRRLKLDRVATIRRARSGSLRAGVERAATLGTSLVVMSFVCHPAIHAWLSDRKAGLARPIRLVCDLTLPGCPPSVQVVAGPSGCTEIDRARQESEPVTWREAFQRSWQASLKMNNASVR